MSFSTSSAPDITEGLPFLVGAADASTQMQSAKGVVFDCALGGVGFKIASSDSRPYQRQTARSQKEQFDTSREAGEQTLAQFWLRSQTSWHLGAGIVNYEPGSDEETQHRFADSLGVDVWHEGDVSLLKRSTLVGATTGAGVAYATSAVVAGAPVVITNEDGTVHRRDGASGNTTYTGVTNAGTRVALAGTKILVGRPTSIAVGDASGSSLADLWTGAATMPVPYWVKSRIVASVGASLWELTLAGGAWPATALHTHPDSGWTWSAVAEAPAAVLAAGYSSGISAIYRFSLEDAGSGTTPQLSQAYQVAEMPPGEEIHSLHVYLGRYIGIGTSRGLRVGILTDNGDMQYGPLIIETTSPVRSITAADRFLYGAVTTAHPDGLSGAVRVDLSNQIGDGTLRFPYAWDARTTTTGIATSVAVLGGTRVAVGVADEGVYLQHATELEESGWLDTGRIRFSTVEPKAFRSLDVTTTIPDGTLQIEAVEKDGDRFYLGTMTSQTGDGMNISISRPTGTFEFLTFRCTLARSDTDATSGPTLESFQVKAVPTPRRQRLIQVPLLCMDQEEDRFGTPYGHEGFAWQRLQALEEVEEFNAVVTFEDNTNDETFQALVEQVTFTSATPSDPTRSKQGFLTLVLRKL